ncbi:hypothetical protein ACQP2T_31325 [Nonomuraea sp. CA-143628]|uniref:hypothetical protein n=1 Tax=Nonomuraea sp. CA-143628 TaxID=3239997 RepID=UPI003D8F2207
MALVITSIWANAANATTISTAAVAKLECKNYSKMAEVDVTAKGVSVSVPYYKGQFCIDFHRTSTRVDSLRYEFGSLFHRTCEWWVNFDFWDGLTGEQYYHWEAGQQRHFGCSRWGSGTRNVANDPNVPPLRSGQVCGTLYTGYQKNAILLTTVCKYVAV